MIISTFDWWYSHSCFMGFTTSRVGAETRGVGRWKIPLKTIEMEVLMGTFLHVFSVRWKISFWVNFITTEPCSPSLESLFFFLYGKSSPNGPTFQVGKGAVDCASGRSCMRSPPRWWLRNLGRIGVRKPQANWVGSIVPNATWRLWEGQAISAAMSGWSLFQVSKVNSVAQNMVKASTGVGFSRDATMIVSKSWRKGRRRLPAKIPSNRQGRCWQNPGLNSRHEA